MVATTRRPRSPISSLLRRTSICYLPRFFFPVLMLLMLTMCAWHPVHAETAAPTAPPPEHTTPAPTLHGHTASQLETMLAHPEAKQRIQALTILREIASRAVPVFIWALDDPDPTVRIAAIRSLAPLGRDSEPAAIPLAQLLVRDPVPAVQTLIIYVLGQMGPYAVDAIPVLEDLMRGATLTRRVNIAQALQRIRDGLPRS